MLQWIDSVLSQGREVEFFYDEFRCPVYVKDVVNVILSITKMWISGMYEAIARNTRPVLFFSIPISCSVSN